MCYLYSFKVVILVYVPVINLSVFIFYPFCLLSRNGLEPFKYFFLLPTLILLSFVSRGCWSDISEGKCFLPGTSALQAGSCSTGVFSRVQLQFAQDPGLLFWRQPLTEHAVPQHQTSTASKYSAVPISMIHVAINPPASNFPQQFSCVFDETPLCEHYPPASQRTNFWKIPLFQRYGNFPPFNEPMVCLLQQDPDHRWRTSPFGCSDSSCRKRLLFIFFIPILELPLSLLHLFFITLSPCYPT